MSSGVASEGVVGAEASLCKHPRSRRGCGWRSVTNPFRLHAKPSNYRPRKPGPRFRRTEGGGDARGQAVAGGRADHEDLLRAGRDRAAVPDHGDLFGDVLGAAVGMGGGADESADFRGNDHGWPRGYRRPAGWQPSFAGQPAIHQSLADLGSSASRRPSPRKLSESSVRMKKIEGKMSREGLESMRSAPSLIRMPQLE